MICKHQYGPLKLGVSYDIMEEGYDYYAVHCRGRIVYVPKWAFHEV